LRLRCRSFRQSGRSSPAASGQKQNRSSHGDTEPRGRPIQYAFLRVPAPPREDRLSPLTHRNPQSKPSSRRGAGARRKGKILISRKGAKTPRNPLFRLFLCGFAAWRETWALGFSVTWGLNRSSHGATEARRRLICKGFPPCPCGSVRGSPFAFDPETQSQNHPLAEAQRRRGAEERQNRDLSQRRKDAKKPFIQAFPLGLRGLAKDLGLGFFPHLGPKPVLSRGHGGTGRPA